ncbi:F0F1 ATP synthase subunit gamma [Entomobacter blattae]|uniref:ATP synthase gamma chain n=1 Tax=Entomobacter blattae TaxID=2762277 RepID=A0A7H1NPX2_9PROT|nr:F0F1 ATP synthase subunit gamma [Entomobacter blattae]QNT77832.1 ATP synthase gamma chain [Entomobacter blattae]
MASLKELQRRIASVKSTRKITSAMKVVAAAKLRRAQARAEEARPYAEALENMLRRVGQAVSQQANLSPLISGTGREAIHLLLPITSDRGLAGGFNANINRKTRQMVKALQAEGKTVKLFPVGKKGTDFLKREFSDIIIESRDGTGGKDVAFDYAQSLATRIETLYKEGVFDICTVVYNRFKNVMTQIPTELQLIPLSHADKVEEAASQKVEEAQYEFEPDEQTILDQLLPKNLQIQIFAALLESAAGEQGARMSAMDGATRNAGKSIDRLSLQYNTTRQANITNQLIEIISGANTV